MQRIAIDARMFGDGGTGVSTYARSLLAALPLVGRVPAVVRDEGPADAFARRRRFFRALSPWGRRLRSQASDDAHEAFVGADIFRVAQVHFNLYGRLLPLRVAGPPGIMHWTYPVPLRIVGWCNVYTVHDAIPIDQPALTPIDRRRHLRLLRAITAEAAALVTVSQSARRSIIAATGCGPTFVTDCAQPVIVPTGPLPVPDGLVPGRYLLFCGSIEPRKNLDRLIAAHRSSGTHLPLLLVGPDGWRAGKILAAIQPGDTVRRLPYQGREALLGLIAHARALLFPSLAEGFGLPVVEAMALGTAVLTSQGGALTETAGDAALTVDPLDVTAIATAIARLAGDDILLADLVARGRVRAAHFTLDRFARRLAAFYDALS